MSIEVPTGKFTPEYEARLMKAIEDRRNDIEYDPLSQCVPPGYPRWLDLPFLREFIVTPYQTTMIAEAFNSVRRVYTDGRDHPPLEDLWPTVTGNSIGHWEGDTLVIDTIMVTNPNEFFQGNPPLSEEARYVERIWLDGEKLRSQITITDPVTLSGPWVANTVLVRETAFDRMIQVDWNNDRTGVEGNTNTIEPPKD